MSELRSLAILTIQEPPLPVREAMDEHKLNELAESMREVGLVQPISVKPSPDGFEIVAGHRRYLAARKLGWTEIKAIVFAEGELKDEAAMLAENIHREDLTAAEEALWFSQLMEKRGVDTIALAKMVGRSQDYVEERLNLFQGDELVYAALRKREINFSVARELNRFKDEGQRRYHLDAAIRSTPPARMVQTWRIQAEGFAPAQLSPANGNTVPGEPMPVQEFVLQCFLCGGNKDPYNIEHVPIHRHCKAHVEKVMQEATNGR